MLNKVLKIIFFEQDRLDKKLTKEGKQKRIALILFYITSFLIILGSVLLLIGFQSPTNGSTLSQSISNSEFSSFFTYLDGIGLYSGKFAALIRTAGAGFSIMIIAIPFFLLTITYPVSAKLNNLATEQEKRLAMPEHKRQVKIAELEKAKKLLELEKEITLLKTPRPIYSSTNNSDNKKTTKKKNDKNETVTK